jgi:hypothetical protein
LWKLRKLLMLLVRSTLAPSTVQLLFLPELLKQEV